MTRLPKLKKGSVATSWRRRILLAGLLFLLALGLYKFQRIWRLVHAVQVRFDQLQAVADGRVDLGLATVDEHLRDVHADLKALRSEAAPFLQLTRYLGWVPVVGGDLHAAPALLDIAISTVEVGRIAFDGLEPLVALTQSNSVEGRVLARVLESLIGARPALDAASTRLAEVLERRSGVDEGALSTRTASLVARLDRFLFLMQTGLDGGRLLPDLLGASGVRTYLFLAQNNDELRATGGFISAVGKLVLDQGEIIELTFEDSYAVDDFSHPYPDSPPQFLRYMGIDQWVFRDANWSPDFPTSAKRAVELYTISRELDVDGVLAVDQYALQSTVAALDPLEVADWPEQVTDKNVISLIRLAWSPSEVENWSGFDAKWWRQRKRFMGDLVGAMRAKLETAPNQVNWLALAQAVFGALDERHFQIWLADPNAPAVDLLDENGWDGKVRQTTSDYLLVVDSNLGYNKVNAIVEGSLDYRVLVDGDGAAQATLTVHRTNPSSGDGACDPWPHYGVDYDAIINRCYWDYLRVYVPAGSKLLAATAHPVAADLLITEQRQLGTAEILPEENGKTVFGSFFVLPRGRQTESRFVYQLPLGMLERTEQMWRYRLLVQKQAGTSAIPLRMTLDLPPGANVHSIEVSNGADGPRSARQAEPNRVIFDVTLQTDCIFEILFLLGD